MKKLLLLLLLTAALSACTNSCNGDAACEATVHHALMCMIGFCN